MHVVKLLHSVTASESLGGKIYCKDSGYAGYQSDPARVHAQDESPAFLAIVLCYGNLVSAKVLQ